MQYDFRRILRDCMEHDERIPGFIRCLWQRILQEMSQWNQEDM